MAGLTQEDIRAFTRKINSLVITAADQEELYRKLNTLERQGRGGWSLLRVPVWRDGRLTAVVLRARID